jgi:hypothetical protein
VREEVEHKPAYSISASLFMTMTNTSNYDHKSGRCIHHPHIRLRKKNLFGRGWTQLMSACPDCCVGELCRLQLVQENMKRSMNKEKKTEGNNHEGSLDVSYHTTTTASSEGNNSRRNRDEGGTPTKRISIKLSRSSSIGDYDGPKALLPIPRQRQNRPNCHQLRRYPRHRQDDLHPRTSIVNQRNYHPGSARVTLKVTI